MNAIDSEFSSLRYAQDNADKDRHWRLSVHGRERTRDCVSPPKMAPTISFDLDKRSRPKCFGEELGLGVLVLGEFDTIPSSAEEGPPPVDFLVRDPMGKEVDWKSSGKEDAATNEFEFTTAYDGEYMFCFVNKAKKTLRVGFDVSFGANARFQDVVAKKENVKPIEASLLYLDVQLKNLQNKVEDIRNHEMSMELTTENTRQRVLGFSFLTIVALLVFGLWEIYYLKRYFRSKYII